jgi:diguanylate cyclase (GGDEF)-like protein
MSKVKHPAVTVSIGVALYTDSVTSPEELVYRADAAMYGAKAAGKNVVQEWTPASQTLPRPIG